jgi:hypothetical protein
MVANSFWRYAGHNTPTPPDTLYHYTNREGLFGILSSFTLWASSSQYLNDATEVAYSTELIAEIANDLRAKTTDWFEKQFLAHAIQMNSAIDFKRQLFICSLSEKDDLLSQWRAYGKPGNAYSIGFNSGILTNLLKEHHVLLAPCLYERDAQVLRARELIATAFREFCAEGFVEKDAQTSPLSPKLTQAMTNVHLAFVQAAALIKHPAFYEEREWRLIRIGPLTKFEFRAGGSYLIPYIELPIASGLARGLLKEVVIGPSPHPILDKTALEWFLNEQGADGTSVRSSKVPFRT